MKKILWFACVITLFATTGCIYSEREGRHERHEEVIVGPPVVVVRPPEVIVH